MADTAEICRAEYVATLEESLQELEKFLQLLQQLARSSAADALVRIVRLLDAH